MLQAAELAHLGLGLLQQQGLVAAFTMRNIILKFSGVTITLLGARRDLWQEVEWKQQTLKGQEGELRLPLGEQAVQHLHLNLQGASQQPGCQ